jgi:hypothetical protein
MEVQHTTNIGNFDIFFKVTAIFFKHFYLVNRMSPTKPRTRNTIMLRHLYSAFFLTVAIGNCMVKLIPPVNFSSDENIQTIF